MSPSLALAALAAMTGLAVVAVRLVVARRRLAAELLVTRRLFSDCMNLAPFCAYIKDIDGRYLYENPALVAATRRGELPVSSFLGKTDDELFPADQAHHYMSDDRHVMRDGKPRTFDNSSVDSDGTVHHWFTVKFPWIDEQGRACVAGMSIDMSEVRYAQATAKASEDRCALALEAGRMGTFTLDLATQMLDTSAQFASLHGRPETATRLCIQESLAEVHPDDHTLILEAIQSAISNRAPNRIIYRVIRPGSRIAWIELMGQVYADDAGRPTTVRGVAFDVTEQREAYEELTRRKKVLRRLIEVQENERQTLCHELHDGVIQYTIGAKMQLESARDEADAAVRAERIDAAIDCLCRGITEARQVIRGVRPAVLDDLGLTAAIHDLTEQMAAVGVTVTTTLDEDIDDIPPMLRTTIYRIVQESLTNVRKHAGTDRVTVEVRRAADDVHVRVRDRGPGFDVDEGRARGFGLVGMTERVRLAGGTFWIESQPGSGTQVNARLPVASAGARSDAPVYAAAEPFDVAP